MTKHPAPSFRTPIKERHDFAHDVLHYFYPVHYRFGMEMEQAMGQGRLSRKQAALLWLIHAEAGDDGWISRKTVEAHLSSWFEMSNPNVTKVIRDTASGPTPLLTIEESPGSGREKILRLTDEGHRFVSSMIEAAKRLLADRVGHLPPEELRAGLTFLRRAFG